MKYLALLLFLTTANFGALAGTVEKSSMILIFDSTDYFHRWSKNEQNEFTPKDDSDLAKWKDMVTINVHPSVRNGDQLSKVANQVLGNYQAAGKVVRTNSKPQKAKQPAEHFAVAVLGKPAFLEAVFARFRMHNGTGIVIVYSHRIYGKAGEAMSRWLEVNGEKIEKALMTWDKLPDLESLKKLPQSK